MNPENTEPKLTVTNFDVWKENLTPEAFAANAAYLPCSFCPVSSNRPAACYYDCKSHLLVWAQQPEPPEKDEDTPTFTKFDVWKKHLTPIRAAGFVYAAPCSKCPAYGCRLPKPTKCEACFLLWAKDKPKPMLTNFDKWKEKITPENLFDHGRIFCKTCPARFTCDMPHERWICEVNFSKWGRSEYKEAAECKN